MLKFSTQNGSISYRNLLVLIDESLPYQVTPAYQQYSNVLSHIFCTRSSTADHCLATEKECEKIKAGLLFTSK